MSYHQEQWNKMVAEAAADNLEDNVRRFFAILDTVESTDEGRDFKPVFISSCRVQESAKLKEILNAMKQQSGYKGA